MVTMSRATEDYLKAIYHLAHRGEAVTTGQLAHELGVSSPSVSAMVKRLANGSLLARPDARTLRLTDSGERAALRVVRRHRLLETFLHRMLDVPWDEVHAEAERLEHAISERLEERIDTALGHPTHDPHGDPIPPRDGPHEELWGTALAAVPSGTRFRVDRISDRDSAALRYLGELGVFPGVVLSVQEQEPFGGPRWVRIGHRRCPLGAPLTRLVHGHVLEPHDDRSDDLASRDLASHDLASHDLASHDLASHDLASRDLASRDLASHDLASHDLDGETS